MRAFAIPSFNSPGSIVEQPIPTPADGEILVRVHAAGVNPMDPMVVSGGMAQMVEHRLPLVPGFDYAGTVESIGPSVDGVEVGDEVYGAVGKSAFGEGSWADYATVSAALTNRRPEGLDAVTAASLPTAGGEALALVDAAGVAAGQTVLIIGANGGVGSFATRLSVGRGATVLAASRSEHADYVRSLGPTVVLENTEDLVAQVRERYPDGVDALIDTYHDVEGLRSVVGAARTGGRIVSPIAYGADEAFAGETTKVSMVSAALDRVGELGVLAARGELGVPVEPVPLDDAGRALQAIARPGVRGKLVIVMR